MDDDAGRVHHAPQARLESRSALGDGLGRRPAGGGARALDLGAVLVEDSARDLHHRVVAVARGERRDLLVGE